MTWTVPKAFTAHTRRLNSGNATITRIAGADRWCILCASPTSTVYKAKLVTSALVLCRIRIDTRRKNFLSTSNCVHCQPAPPTLSPRYRPMAGHSKNLGRFRLQAGRHADLSSFHRTLRSVRRRYGIYGLLDERGWKRGAKVGRG